MGPQVHDHKRKGRLQISCIIAMSFPFANISVYSSSKIMPVESPVTTRNSMPNSSASGRTRSSEIKSTSQPLERKRKASATKGWRSPRVPTLQKAHFMIPNLQRNQIEPKSCSWILHSSVMITLLAQHCRSHVVSPMKVFSLFMLIPFSLLLTSSFSLVKSVNWRIAPSAAGCLCFLNISWVRLSMICKCHAKKFLYLLSKWRISGCNLIFLTWDAQEGMAFWLPEYKMALANISRSTKSIFE